MQKTCTTAKALAEYTYKSKGPCRKHVQQRLLQKTCTAKALAENMYSSKGPRRSTPPAQIPEKPSRRKSMTGVRHPDTGGVRSTARNVGRPRNGYDSEV